MKIDLLGKTELSRARPRASAMRSPRALRLPARRSWSTGAVRPGWMRPWAGLREQCPCPAARWAVSRPMSRPPPAAMPARMVRFARICGSTEGAANRAGAAPYLRRGRAGGLKPPALQLADIFDCKALQTAAGTK